MVDTSRHGATAKIRVTLDTSARAIDQLRREIWTLADDNSIKAIVLELPAGAVGPAARSVESEITLRSATGLFQTVTYLKKPTIAVVRGDCAEFQTLLALSTDLAYATEGSTFAPPEELLDEANLVIGALTLRLNRLKKWVLDGRPLPAREALALGFLNGVAPSNAALDAQVLEALARICRTPLDGLALTKVAFQAFLDSQMAGADFDYAEREVVS